MSRQVTIDQQQAGKRADIVATELLPSLSRAYVHNLFDSGKITINDRREKHGYKLHVGDIINIGFDPEELQQIEDIDLPILYEDENVLVINKPAGVISHSRGRYWYEPSVASFIRQHIHETPKPLRFAEMQGAAEQRTELYKEYGEGAEEAATQQISKNTSGVSSSARKQAGVTQMFGDRAGIVHRLDRATSGVMICAKNQETLSLLQKQFSQRKVKKSYVAIVSGHMKEPHAIIDMPIERNPKQPQMFKVSANGKPAQTEYEVTQTYAKHDKLLLKPLTGRTHQLRVHLKHVGHPIVGDTLYGTEPYERLLLHAYSLEVTLPGSKRTTFTAPEPKEFEAFDG